MAEISTTRKAMTSTDIRGLSQIRSSASLPSLVGKNQRGAETVRISNSTRMLTARRGTVVLANPRKPRSMRGRP